jgi:hypothetical protein
VIALTMSRNTRDKLMQTTQIARNCLKPGNSLLLRWVMFVFTRIILVA